MKDQKLETSQCMMHNFTFNYGATGFTDNITKNGK